MFFKHLGINTQKRNTGASCVSQFRRLRPFLTGMPLAEIR